MTVTSNVHIGTLAWVAGAVTAGAGRSNAGQVYRALNSTTSAAPGPAHTSGTVTDGGGVQWKWLSGFDYSTFASWWASIPATLADAYVGIFWNHGEIVSSVGGEKYFDLTAKTTTTAFNITLQVAPGDAFYDAASPRLFYDATKGFAVQKTGAYASLINLALSNIVFRGFQLRCTGNNAQVVHSDQVLVLDRCILSSGSVSQAGGTAVYTKGTVSNCLIEMEHATATGVILNYPCTVINCTLVKPSNLTAGGSAMQAVYGKATVKNCAIFGFTAAPLGSPFSADGHNGSDLATPAPGATGNASGIAHTTATFVQPSVATPTTADFRLATGSALLGLGAVDVALLPSGVDIMGTPRYSSWSIGAWQPVSAPPPVRPSIMFVSS